MIWLEASYQPTALFSLKPSWATSSGGKSLLMPSPYALKMAVLDVAIRSSGLEAAKTAWPWLRGLQIGIDLPSPIVVTNLFAKVLRQRRNPAPPGTPDAGPYQKTIGYREYVYYPHPIRLLFGIVKEGQSVQLAQWLVQVNYFGKRGGFVQLLGPPASRSSDDGFIRLTQDPAGIPTQGIIQQVEDCGPRMKFEHADIYDSKRPDRIVRHIVIPYRLARSSRSYSLYERIND